VNSGLNMRSLAVLVAIGVAGAVAIVSVTLMIVLFLLRTGGAKAVSDNAALIAALVALGGVFLAQMVSIALDARRTQESRSLEAQRAQEAAVQNYFEQVGTLLSKRSPGANPSTVVRAQTLATLEGLDPEHKRMLLQFLRESELIHREKAEVSLVFANLSRANLREAYLHETDLRGTDLSGADLSEAILSGADLSGADLSGANLRDANLPRTILSGADLSNANLSGAILSGADLSNAILSEDILALISGPNMSEADLRDAKQIQTNLRGAKGITAEELEQQAYSLEGAIMPDGSKHP
jgi:uncharacterized protein YjbI with pentapeptide repeats